jgi:hypothetical protein
MNKLVLLESYRGRALTAASTNTPRVTLIPCCRGTGSNLPPLSSSPTPPDAANLMRPERLRPRPHAYESSAAPASLSDTV